MYKEMAICFITIILIFSLDFITSNYTKESINEVSEKLIELKNDVKQEEITNEKNKEKVNEIFQIWKRRYDILALYLEHDELEKIETNINCISGEVETEEYNNVVSEIDKTVFILHHIEEKNKIDLRNVL